MNARSAFARDPRFWLLLTAGLAAWGLPAPPPAPPPWRLALGAVAEEAAFRWGLQETLARRWPAPMGWMLGPVSAANLAASAGFALLHLFAHPPAWALGTFLPSLAFGWLWDRHRSLAACALLHLAYNLLYFYRP